MKKNFFLTFILPLKMIRESYELVSEMDNSKLKEALYSSYDLADNTFAGIIKKYSDYRFEEYVENLRNEFNCKSFSHISFYLEYKISDICQIINLFNATMEIFNREEIEYLVNICEETLEIKAPLVDGFLKNKYSESRVKAIVYTKFFIDRSLDIEDQYEDAEPSIPLVQVELPFVSDECCICLSEKPNIILFPCLHKTLCLKCEEEGKLTKCPTCRVTIDRKIYQ